MNAEAQAVKKRGPIPEPWSLAAAEVLGLLGVSADQGLDEREVRLRLRRYGRNLLRTTKPRHLLAILIDQFRSAVILLLGAAAIVAMAFGDFVESLAILAVIAINTAIGFLTEWRAIRSMEALKQLGRVDTVVRRGGRTRKIQADGLVPGDVVIIEGGDIITADIRLLEVSKLQADESTLTGESVPVAKQTAPLDSPTVLMERSNLLFKGTAITRGSGLGVVVATGPDTELGLISRLVADATAQETPLEKRLNALGQRLVWVMLIVAALIAVAGIMAGRETLLAIEVAIALAVAAIPEGLPIVATIALARGMWRMARRNALIVRLSAVETLGATGVILTDKTGTLTENRMTLSTIELIEGEVRVGGTGLDTHGDFEMAGSVPGGQVLGLVDDLLKAVVLCSNASLELDSPGVAKVVGDPTETALLIAAAKRNIRRDTLQQAMPELREEPFESETKAMATFNRANGAVLVSVKGAPESVLPHCVAMRTTQGDVPMSDDQRETQLNKAHALGHRGLRTLAVATRVVQDANTDPYADLVFLGVVGLLDPPRPGVREAISCCRDAGIRVVMVTGDHVATAHTIAIDLGLVDPHPPDGAIKDARTLSGRLDEFEEADLDQLSVIARATPQQKLDLIALYQEQGNVVAMTGDGVNDAPALKKADIGIAMGIRGTAVAKEAAAMVLQDDEFSTIVAAIAHGRTIFENIRKFVVYLFSCNTSEILIVSLATVAGAPLPLLPLQILLLNLVTDVFPALALGVSRGSPEVLTRKPHPIDEPILSRQLWSLIVIYGVLMAASVLAAMAVAIYLLGFSEAKAVSVSFCTLALSQLWHVFNMRDKQQNWIRNEITCNVWIWAAIALCLLLILGAVYIPGVNDLLGLVNPGRAGWLLIVGMSMIPLVLGPWARKISLNR